MTQFKDKSERNEVVRGGLLTYPVLMAADILLYDTELVPVGDDQRQHLELARELAERFNNRFGETFVVPDGPRPEGRPRASWTSRTRRARCRSRRTRRRARSSCSTTPDAIARKVRRAVTDTDGEVRYDPSKKPGVSNLLEILASLARRGPPKGGRRATTPTDR